MVTKHNPLKFNETGINKVLRGFVIWFVAKTSVSGKSKVKVGILMRFAHKIVSFWVTGLLESQ